MDSGQNAGLERIKKLQATSFEPRALSYSPGDSESPGEYIKKRFHPYIVNIQGWNFFCG